MIGILVAAAIAVPIVFLVLGGDDEPTAGSTTTTRATTTTGGGSSTTATTTTTAPTTTSSSTSSTTSSSTTSSTSSTTTSTSTTTTTTSGALQLDYSLPANYDEFDLVSGFLPDPWESTALSGGPVDTTYLGGGCLGWASQAPDFQVNYTAASSSLRFYFVADTVGDDTTLIISDPSGNWVCGDDSYGTRNPTVDFTGTAPDGVYDIWIGSYSSGAGVTGTFYVTELDSNHP